MGAKAIKPNALESEPRTPRVAQLDTVSARVAAALAVGWLCCAGDLGVHFFLAGREHLNPTSFGWTILGLPLLAASAAALILRFAPSWILLPLPIAGAYHLGHHLGAGRRARELWMAEHWSWLAAATAVGVIAVAWRASSAAPRRRRRVLTAAFFVTGFLIFSLASLWQRGRYLEVKDAALIILSACWFAGFLNLLARIAPRGKALAVLVLFSAALGLGGLLLTLRGGPDLDFALARTTVTTRIATWTRAAFSEELDDTTLAPGEIPQFLGSDLDRRSRREFAESDGLPRGVLIITADAMRWDLIGKSVGGRPVAPTISALAQKGMLFERAYCPAPISQLAFYGMYSGLYPSQFLGREDGFNNIPLVTTRLREAKVETRSVIPRGVMTIDLENLKDKDLGFEFPTGHQWYDLKVEEVIERLTPEREGRFLLHWHTMRPHFPYDKHAQEFATGDSPWERYCADVRHADDDVRRVLEGFKSAGLLDDMWIIISADHGEEFQEHGYERHGTQLYEESVRVPLIVVGPGIPKGRFSGCVSLTDFAPTLEQIFDLDPQSAPPCSARGWLPALAGMVDGLETLTETAPADADQASGPLRSIEVWPSEVVIDLPPEGPGKWNTSSSLATPSHKLIVDEHNRRLRLFDLNRDPAEHKNIAHLQDEEAKELLAVLRRRQRAPITPATAPYGDLATVAEMTESCARMGAKAVAAVSHTVRDWPEESALRVLCHFSDFRTPEYSLDVEERFEDDSREMVRIAWHALRVSNRRGSPEEWAKLKQALPRIEDDELRAVIFEIAVQKQDRDLLPAAEEALEHDLTDANQSSQFTAALLLFELTRRPFEAKRLNRALKTPRTWIRRRAAALASSLDLPVDDALLQSLEVDAEGYWMRYYLRFARFARSTSRAELIKSSLASDERSFQEAAFGFLGLKTPDAGAYPARFFREGISLDGVTGIELAAPWYGHLVADTARVPLAVKGPGRLGLFLQLATVDDSRPEVAIKVGGFETVINLTSHDPAVPVVLDLPDNADGRTIEIKLKSGDRRGVLIGGLIWAAFD